MDVSQLIQAAANVMKAQAVGQAAARLQGNDPASASADPLGGVPSAAAASQPAPAPLSLAAGLTAALGAQAAASAPALAAPSASSQLAALLRAALGGAAAAQAGAAQSPLARALSSLAPASQALQQQLQSVQGGQLQKLLLEQQAQKLLLEQQAQKMLLEQQAQKLLLEQQTQKLQQLQQQKLELDLLAAKSSLASSSMGLPAGAEATAERSVPSAALPSTAPSAASRGPRPKAPAPAAPARRALPSERTRSPQVDARAEAERAKQAAKQEALAKAKEVEESKCHLHKKPKDGCKFCKRHQDLVNSVQDEKERMAAALNAENRRRSSRVAGAFGAGSDALLEVANRKSYGLASTLQAHLVDARYYVNALTPMQTVGELIEEARRFVTNVEPYMPDSTVMPSPFFCIVYRLFTMGVTGNQMQKILESNDSPFVRCMGFVYLRYALQADHLWGWLGEYVTDDEEFTPSAGSSSRTTIGEFVESLLLKEKYYTTLLPRVSGGVRRTLEEKLAAVGTYRKRMKANAGVLEVYRRMGTRVEVCLDGEWHKATTLEVEDHRSRPKVVVRLSDGMDEAVHLGMVILCDEPARRADRGRSRSRSREVDWSRQRGKSTAELVEEMRRAERERAVCSSGQAYSKRPSTFDKGLATPREGQGVASRKLLEEETYVKANSQRRNSPQPQRAERDAERRPSLEHQERMRQLFEKYGNVQDKKPKRDPERADYNIDEPDKLRLG